MYEKKVVPVAGLEQPLRGAEDREPEPHLGDEAAAEEVPAGDLREARDLGRGEPQRAELRGDGRQGPVDARAEDARVGGHDGGDLLRGEPEAREEGEHGVRVGERRRPQRSPRLDPEEERENEIEEKGSG